MIRQQRPIKPRSVRSKIGSSNLESGIAVEDESKTVERIVWIRRFSPLTPFDLVAIAISLSLALFALSEVVATPNVSSVGSNRLDAETTRDPADADCTYLSHRTFEGC